ncbi:MAG TPA: TPM domain-containing protein [Opitutaceae bacterium]|jgi:uncharacterized membrane protein|nr:TPM domain-containing protein [Opitutaceae bacterium]
MRWLFASPAPIDHARVVEAIRAAEAGTSGEIRVVIARHRTRHPIVSARKHFVRLGMGRTPEHNGVLIFVAPRSHNFAVVGDKGIHGKAGDNHWNTVTEAMRARFVKGDFTGGIVAGVACAGRELARHFPRQPGDRPNLLPDKVEEVE